LANQPSTFRQLAKAQAAEVKHMEAEVANASTMVLRSLPTSLGRSQKGDDLACRGFNAKLYVCKWGAKAP
jgi:hypothetical protein